MSDGIRARALEWLQKIQGVAGQAMAALNGPLPTGPDALSVPAPFTGPGGPVLVTETFVARKGVNKKGPWTLTVVKFSNGQSGSTFLDSIVKEAETALSDHTAVTPVLTPGQQPGQYTLVSLHGSRAPLVQNRDNDDIAF